MIGVFGGTFDPVHYGHLRPLLEVKEALGLDEVRLIPSCIPPHRGVPAATPEQRLSMLQLALGDTPGFVIDERELRRGGRSFMVDTLQSLRDGMGNESLSLILGMDAFSTLDSWYRWQQLIELAHIVVMQRPGRRLPQSGAVAALVAERRVREVSLLQQSPAGQILFQNITQLGIAATEIRSMLAKKGDVRFLMPEPVRQYIVENQLYR